MKPRVVVTVGVTFTSMKVTFRNDKLQNDDRIRSIFIRHIAVSSSKKMPSGKWSCGGRDANLTESKEC